MLKFFPTKKKACSSLCKYIYIYICNVKTLNLPIQTFFFFSSCREQYNAVCIKNKPKSK